jgi:hypothetical protein
VASPETTDPYALAVEYSSPANALHACAAASIGPEPGPVYIRPELISGGSIAKSIAAWAY